MYSRRDCCFFFSTSPTSTIASGKPILKAQLLRHSPELLAYCSICLIPQKPCLQPAIRTGEHTASIHAKLYRAQGNGRWQVTNFGNVRHEGYGMTLFLLLPHLLPVSRTARPAMHCSTRFSIATTLRLATCLSAIRQPESYLAPYTPAPTPWPTSLCAAPRSRGYSR